MSQCLVWFNSNCRMAEITTISNFISGGWFVMVYDGILLNLHKRDRQLQYANYNQFENLNSN